MTEYEKELKSKYDELLKSSLASWRVGNYTDNLHALLDCLYYPEQAKKNQSDSVISAMLCLTSLSIQQTVSIKSLWAVCNKDNLYTALDLANIDPAFFAANAYLYIWNKCGLTDCDFGNCFAEWDTVRMSDSGGTLYVTLMRQIIDRLKVFYQ